METANQKIEIGPRDDVYELDLGRLAARLELKREALETTYPDPEIDNILKH